jgi:osmotically-inducible protein OsmY
MKRILCGALLLFAALVFAQQQNPPPYNTSPTFPGDRITPERFPPDTKAPLQQELSPAEIQEQIQKKLDTEPALSSVTLKAAVDDRSVVLTGTVDDERQHDLALRVAESYAGERQIVDKIEVRGRS